MLLSKPCCTKKGAFTPLTRPPTLPFFACMPSFTPEYSQSSPAAARIRSDSGGNYARNPASRHIALPSRFRESSCCVLLRPLFPPRFPRMSPGSAVCCTRASCCVVSSHGSLRPPSLSAMMEHTFMLIMPDCHGRLFCFAVEKSMTPRGDQIPVVGFQSTAPPSRVNFREIRAPGVCASPNANKP